jgi:hypothetical protein
VKNRHVANRLIVVFAACAVVSCGNSGPNASGSESSANAGFQPLSQRLDRQSGFSQDAEGNWQPAGSNQRSQFEGRSASGTNTRNQFEASRFSTRSLDRPQWARNEAEKPQRFDGHTDGSGFQTPAADQNRRARDANARARIPGNYRTSPFATSQSRENNAKRHDRPTDYQTERARDSFEDPSITDWREQRNLSLDQSRSILSR